MSGIQMAPYLIKLVVIPLSVCYLNEGCGIAIKIEIEGLSLEQPKESKNQTTVKQLPAYDWVFSDINSPIPPNAVKCCQDEKGNDIYIGKSNADNHLLVGVKIIPAIKKATYPYFGGERETEIYMVLINRASTKPVWVSNQDGKVPADAVSYGMRYYGLELFIGRASHNGTTVPGEVVPTYGKIYVPFGKAEHTYTNYEVLVYRADEE